MIVMILLIGILPGCGQGGQWKDYTRNISEPIKLQNNGEAAAIGNLDREKVAVFIPAKTFDQKVSIELKNPDSVPAFSSEEAVPLGSPISIEVDSTSKRFNEKATITMKLEAEDVSNIKEPQDIWVSYYNGEKWDFIYPDEVDIKEGYLKFSTYHFSIFSKVKPTAEQRIKEFTHKQAVGLWAEKNSNTELHKTTNDLVKQVLKEELGVSDPTVADAVTQEIINDNAYGKLIQNYRNGQKVQFSQNISLMAGKKIIQVVKKLPVTTSAKILGDVTKQAGKIGAGAKAAGALAGGDTETAMKEIAAKMMDSYPLLKLFETGITLTDVQIKRWKAEEMEAAYKVFRDGANSKVPWWGYNVEAGKFEDVWDQMKGLREKVLSDAINDYAQRKGVSLDTISSEELDQVRLQAKEDIKQMFAERKAREAEINQIEAENLKFIEELKKAEMLEKGNLGYTFDCSLEFWLERLFRTKEIIEGDIGGRKLSYGSLDTKDQVSVKTMIRLMKAWYAGDENKQTYRNLLAELGFAEKIKLSDLAGDWQGNAVITYIFVDERLKGQKSKDTEGLGCDGDILAGLEARKGIPTPCTVNLTPSGDNSGIISSSNFKPLNFTYQNGEIKAVKSLGGDSVTVKLVPSLNNDVYQLNGNATVIVKSGMAKIESTIALSR